MFRDRDEGGTALGARLAAWADRTPVVLGLPRGGIPVAAAVARALGAPLDVILVRKLGVPSQPELAMGAIGEGGIRVLNDDVLRVAGVSPADVDRAETRERVTLSERALRYRGGDAMLAIDGRTVVVVDDGIATGATARAAVAVARAHGASEVVLAAPVAAAASVRELREVADAVVVARTPEPFAAVGQWYEQFPQVGDDEVVDVLQSWGIGSHH